MFWKSVSFHCLEVWTEPTSPISLFWTGTVRCQNVLQLEITCYYLGIPLPKLGAICPICVKRCQKNHGCWIFRRYRVFESGSYSTSAGQWSSCISSKWIPSFFKYATGFNPGKGCLYTCNYKPPSIYYNASLCIGQVILQQLQQSELKTLKPYLKVRLCWNYSISWILCIT